MAQKKEQWGSRFGFIMAAMGMAIGTGNIWRFPRVVGNNGGGAFLIAYLIANMTWAVPLIMSEIAIGKHTRLGTIGAFRDFGSKKKSWQGGWIMFVCAAITFYYVIVFAWALRYFVFSLQGTFKSGLDTDLLWNSYISNPVQGIIFQAIAVIIVGFIIYRGVNKGLETAGKVMIPVLFICLIVSAIWAISKPGAMLGLKYLFVPKWEELLNSKIWLNAYTQAAWSSGAGWGMMLTYANYMKKNEDVAVNSFMIVFGDALGAIVAAMAVLPTVFALSASESIAVDALSQGNTGLTFIYITRLFTNVPGGLLISSLFFLALSLAALTSLLPQMEVIVKNMQDTGLTREKSTIIMLIVTFIFGIPSAININIFNNQDWVWGIGLLICGLFYAMAIYKYGVDKFRTELINPSSDIKVGKWYNTVIRIHPAILTIIVGWWLWQAVGWSDNWWTPFAVENPGTVVFQCLISMIAFYIANDWLNKIIASSPTKVNLKPSSPKEVI